MPFLFTEDILKNDCSGCYQDNIPYNESQGYFQIPLGGKNIIPFGWYHFKQQSVLSLLKSTSFDTTSFHSSEFCFVLNLLEGSLQCSYMS